jgi:hypothetical protein
MVLLMSQQVLTVSTKTPPPGKTLQALPLGTASTSKKQP